MTIFGWRIYLASLVFSWIFTAECSQSIVTRINVKTYGAKGDGKTDDTKSLISAFKAVSISGGEIYFPAGVYLTDIIDIRPSQNSTIAVQGEKGKVMIKKNITDKTNVALFFCEIKGTKLLFRNLTLNGSSTARKGKWHKADRETVTLDDEINGIYCYNVASLQVENCHIQNFHGKGIAAYNTNQLTAQNNTIDNVNGSAIQGHRVTTLKVLNNTLNHTGFVSAGDLVDGISFNGGKIPATLFGDGIEAECENLIATGNKITNPGRCGIVHDLAKELGYTNSSATVSNNIVIVNGNATNNNPPAGMWFEQSANVTVTYNKIYLRRSSSKFVSGIRFFGITNQINCAKNFIDGTTYNHESDAGIGIYEPKVKKITLTENSINGNFSHSVTLSYGDVASGVDNLLIKANKLFAGKQNGLAITYIIDGKNSFPKNTMITENDFGRNAAIPFDFAYYGLLSVTAKSKIISQVKIFNNKVMGKNSNALPTKVKGVVFTN
jgi:hypothetical protein